VLPVCPEVVEPDVDEPLPWAPTLPLVPLLVLLPWLLVLLPWLLLPPEVLPLCATTNGESDNANAQTKSFFMLNLTRCFGFSPLSSDAKRHRLRCSHHAPMMC
jgi:hypothetical protein